MSNVQYGIVLFLLTLNIIATVLIGVTYYWFNEGVEVKLAIIKAKLNILEIQGKITTDQKDFLEMICNKSTKNEDENSCQKNSEK